MGNLIESALPLVVFVGKNKAFSAPRCVFVGKITEVFEPTGGQMPILEAGST